MNVIGRRLERLAGKLALLEENTDELRELYLIEQERTEEGDVLWARYEEKLAKVAKVKAWLAESFDMLDGLQDDMDAQVECPRCEKMHRMSEMAWSRDCMGIPFREVCEDCLDDIAQTTGFDGEKYTELDENIVTDY